MESSNLYKYYNNLKEGGVPVPDWGTFKGKLTQNGYATRKGFYDTLKGNGVPVPNTYEEWANVVFKGAKPLATQAQAQPKARAPKPQATQSVASGLGKAIGGLIGNAPKQEPKPQAQAPKYNTGSLGREIGQAITQPAEKITDNHLRSDATAVNAAPILEIHRKSDVDTSGLAKEIGASYDKKMAEAEKKVHAWVEKDHEKNGIARGLVSNPNNPTLGVSKATDEYVSSHEAITDPAKIIDEVSAEILDTQHAQELVAKRFNELKKQYSWKMGIHDKDGKVIDDKYLMDMAASDIADEVQKVVVARESERAKPKDWIDYFAGQQVHNTITGKILSANAYLLADLKGSSGMRRGIQDTARANYGEEHQVQKYTSLATEFGTDSSVMAVGGMIGETMAAPVVGKAAQYMGGNGLKMLGNIYTTIGGKTASEVALRNISTKLLPKAIGASIQGGASYATYEGAQTASTQLNRGYFDMGELVSSVAHGAVLGGTSSALGATIGHMTRGGSAFVQGLGKVGGFTSEVSVFALSQIAESGDWSYDNVKGAFLDNTLMVGSMKISHAVTSPKEMYKGIKLRLQKYQAPELRLSKADIEQINNAMGAEGGNELTLIEDLFSQKPTKREQEQLANVEEMSIEDYDAYLSTLAVGYEKVMENPSISNAVKTKLRFFVQGQINLPKSVDKLDAEPTYNEQDGMWHVKTYDDGGNVLDDVALKSEKSAITYIDETEHNILRNNVSARSKVYRQAVEYEQLADAVAKEIKGEPDAIAVIAMINQYRAIKAKGKEATEEELKWVKRIDANKKPRSKKSVEDIFKNAMNATGKKADSNAVLSEVNEKMTDYIDNLMPYYKASTEKREPQGVGMLGGEKAVPLLKLEPTQEIYTDANGVEHTEEYLYYIGEDGKVAKAKVSDFNYMDADGKPKSSILTMEEYQRANEKGAEAMQETQAETIPTEQPVAEQPVTEAPQAEQGKQSSVTLDDLYIMGKIGSREEYEAAKKDPSLYEESLNVAQEEYNQAKQYANGEITEKPNNYDYWKQKMAEEAPQAETPQAPVAEATPTEQVAEQPKAEQVTEQPITNQPVAEQSVAEPQGETTDVFMARLPRKRNGEIDYGNMTPADQVKLLELSEGVDVAKEFANNKVSALAKQLEKAQADHEKALTNGEIAKVRDARAMMDKLNAELNEWNKFGKEAQAEAPQVVEEPKVAEANAPTEQVQETEAPKVEAQSNAESIDLDHINEAEPSKQLEALRTAMGDEVAEQVRATKVAQIKEQIAKVDEAIDKAKAKADVQSILDANKSKQALESELAKWEQPKEQPKVEEQPSAVQEPKVEAPTATEQPVAETKVEPKVEEAPKAEATEQPTEPTEQVEQPKAEEAPQVPELTEAELNKHYLEKRTKERDEIRAVLDEISDKEAELSEKSYNLLKREKELNAELGKARGAKKKEVVESQAEERKQIEAERADIRKQQQVLEEQFEKRDDIRREIQREVDRLEHEVKKDGAKELSDAGLISKFESELDKELEESDGTRNDDEDFESDIYRNEIKRRNLDYDVDAKQLEISKKYSSLFQDETSGESTLPKDDSVKYKTGEGEKASAEETNNAILKLAESLGTKVKIVEEEAEWNGYYEEASNTIVLNKRAANMVQTFGHELTHAIKKLGGEGYSAFAEMARRYLESKGIDYDAKVNKMRDAYVKYLAEINEKKGMSHEEALARAQDKVSFEYAEDEVLADVAGDLLRGNSKKIIDDLRRRTDTTTFGRIKDMVVDMLKRISSYFKEADHDIINDVIAEWENAYLKAKMRDERIVPDEEVVKDGEVIVEKERDGTDDIFFNMRGELEKQADEREKFIKKEVKNGRLTEAQGNYIIKKMQQFTKLADEIGKEVEYFNEWSDVYVELNEEGKPIFNCVVKNAEYELNIDMSLVCKKRRSLDKVLTELTKKTKMVNGVRMSLLDRLSTDDRAFTFINRIIRNHGLETACKLCYIEGKRSKTLSFGEKFANMYNGMLMRIKPEGVEAGYHYFATESKDSEIKDGELASLKDDQLDLSYLKKIVKEKRIYKDDPLFALLVTDNDIKKANKTHPDAPYVKVTKASVAVKMAEYLLKNPKGRRLLKGEDFSTSEAFDNIQRRNLGILTLFNKKKGAGGAKSTFGEKPYNAEVRESGKFTAEKAYKVGGVRLQSFSDFMGKMWFDYTQLFADLSAKQLPLHTYTKEALFAKMFGATGAMVNMSLVPKFDADGVAVGLDKNGNYAWEYDLKKNITESFDPDEAFALRNNPLYNQYCGIIAVGVSDAHVRKMLMDDSIDMVIPYHKSGMPFHLAALGSIDKFQDWEGKQSTRISKINKDGKQVWVGRTKAQQSAIKEPNINELMHSKGMDARKATEEYIKWCEKHRYLPKFVEFVWKVDENGEVVTEDGKPYLEGGKPIKADTYNGYYKVIIDFKAYYKDAKGKEKPTKQGAVKMNFPKNFGEYAMEASKDSERINDVESRQLGSIVDQIERYIINDTSWLPKPEEKDNIPAYLERVNNLQQFKNTFDPDMRYQLKQRDKEYEDAVERGDSEDVERMVAETAKASMANPVVDENGNIKKLYHGTNAFGFTEFNSRRASGAIFTTDKSIVSANYGGANNYAWERPINKGYKETDTTDGIISNAQSVLNQPWRKATEAERNAIIEKVEAEAKPIAEKLDVLKETPTEFKDDENRELSNAISWVENIIYDAAYDRENGNESEQWAKQVARDYEMFNENREIVREYMNTHELDQSQQEYLDYLLGYKLGDVAIDTGLSYAKAFSPEDMATVGGKTLLSVTELADITKSAKDIGSYELYGELGNNPLVVDGKGKNWYDLDFKGMYSTDKIADWAKEQGYTSVTFKDIYDGGDKSNVYVFFDSKELKSADNVTYDNDGNVIPLSKRFDSSEQDIRYQISKQRREELVEKGAKTLAEWNTLSKGEKSYAVQSDNISKRVLMEALKDKDASIASEAARSAKLKPQDVASYADELSEPALGALMFRSAYTPTENGGGFVLPDDVYLKAFASKKTLTRLEALQAVMTHHRPIAKEMYKQAESDKELANKLPQLVGTTYSLDDLGEIKGRLEEVKAKEEEALKNYDGEPLYISLADYYGKVDAENYYVATDTNFNEIASGDYKQVQSEWDKMKDSGKYEWHHSPYSQSEYLVDKGNGDVYRFSDHWGKVGSCDWTLNGEAKQNHFAIGKSNLKDFTRKNYGIENPAFDKYKAEFKGLSKQFSELNNIYNSLTKDVVPEPIMESINRGTGFDKYIRVDERNAVDNENIARAIRTGYAIGNDTRFQFIGKEGASRLDQQNEALSLLDNLDIAREMERERKSEQAIKLATGWERGADGKWRYEIVDDLLDFKDAAPKIKQGTTLGELLGEDNAVIKAYPYLKGFRVESWNAPESYRGQANYLGKRISINKELLEADPMTEEFGEFSWDLDGKELNETLYHEIQHAIQREEGFAQGGSPRMFMTSRRTIAKQKWASIIAEDAKATNVSLKESAKYFFDDAMQQFEGMEIEPRAKTKDYDYDDYLALLDFVNTKDLETKVNELIEESAKPRNPFKMYRQLAGEVESRNVSERLEMTAEERRNKLAKETEDVDRELQNIIGSTLADDARFQLRSADDYATELENDSQRRKWVIDYQEAVKRGSHQAAARAMNKIRNFYVNEAKAEGVDVTERFDAWRNVKAELEGKWGKVSKTASQSVQEVNNFADKIEQDITAIDTTKASGMKAQISSVASSIKKWINGNMPSEIAKEMGSREISVLNAELTNVESLNSRKETTDTQRAALIQRLRSTLRNIRQTTNNAEIRRLANVVNDILTKTKTEKLNDRGVLEAKSVDSLTATIFKAVKGGFAKTNSMRLTEELKTLDDEIHAMDAELSKTADAERRRELLDAITDKRNEFTTKQKEAWDAALAEPNVNRGQIEIDEQELQQRIENKAELSLKDKTDIATIEMRKKFADLDEAMRFVHYWQAMKANAVKVLGTMKLKGLEGDARNEMLANREAQKAEITNLDSAIMQAQANALELLRSTQETLSDTTAEGRARFVDEAEKKMKRKFELIDMARETASYSGLRLIDIAKYNKEKQKKGGLVDILKNIWFEPSTTFKYMLEYIGNQKYYSNDNPLVKRLLTGEEGQMQCEINYSEGIRYYRNKVQDAIRYFIGQDKANAFGETIGYSELRPKDMDKTITLDFATLDAEGNELASETRTLDKGQALYLWMVWQMADGRAKLEAHGCDETMMNQIRDFIGEGYVDFAKYIQDELFPQLREDKYNPVYEERYNMPMAQIEHYFPLESNPFGRFREDDKLDENKEMMGQGTVGNIKQRCGNLYEVNIGINAFDKIMKYGHDMEEWAAFDQLRADVTNLVNDNKLYHMLESREIGLHEKFKVAMQLGTRLYDGSVTKNKAINNFFVGLNKSLAGRAIGFRYWAGLKQLLSIPAYVAECTDKEFALEWAKAMNPAYKEKGQAYSNVEWAMQNLPLFRDRVESGNIGNDVYSDKSIKVVDYYSKVGMLANKKVDAYACAMGARAKYNVVKKRMLNEGYNEVEAHNQAVREAELFYNTSQQSQIGSLKSPQQASQSWGDRAFTLFTNSVRNYYNNNKENINNARLAWKQGDKAKVAEYAFKSGVFGFMLNVLWDASPLFLLAYGMSRSNDDKEKDVNGNPIETEWVTDEDKKGLLLSSLFAPTQGVVVTRMVKNLANGFDNDMPYTQLIKSLGKDWSQTKDALVVADYNPSDYASQFAYSLVLKNALKTGASFVGVDYKTWQNQYLAIKGMIRDGIDFEDILQFANAPVSAQRKYGEEWASKTSNLEEYINRRAWADLYDTDGGKSGFADAFGRNALSDTKRGEYIQNYIEKHIPQYREYKDVQREGTQAKNTITKAGGSLLSIAEAQQNVERETSQKLQGNRLGKIVDKRVGMIKKVYKTDPQRANAMTQELFEQIKQGEIK